MGGKFGLSQDHRAIAVGNVGDGLGSATCQLLWTEGLCHPPPPPMLNSYAEVLFPNVIFGDRAFGRHLESDEGGAPTMGLVPL